MRFPGKVLVKLKDRPILQWVYENAKKACLDKVIIATDDRKIFETAYRFGAEVLMTSSRHRSGTERVAEVARRIKAEVIVNIQGDEPFLKARTINFLIKNFFKDKKAEIGTLATYIRKKEDLDNPNVVKVVFDRNGYALYFSRFAIPYLRKNNTGGKKEVILNNSELLRQYYFKHLGIYVYRRSALLRFVKLPLGKLERMECLEQLRALENGMCIKVMVTSHDSLGIDVPEDLKKAEAWLTWLRK